MIHATGDRLERTTVRGVLFYRTYDLICHITLDALKRMASRCVQNKPLRFGFASTNEN
jgi:hypothetical protein